MSNQTNQEALLEFIRGFAFSTAVIGIFLLLIVFLGSKEEEPLSKFEVVDRYRGCDVIRYTDSTSRWNYLLDCNGK